MADKWKGVWIWTQGDPSPKNFYLHLRREFTLSDRVKSADVRVTADSRYILWVNGQQVSRGPVRSDPRWQSFDQVDISRHLKEGTNVVSALVHHYGESTYSYHLGRGAFLFDCTIRTKDGGKQDISSGSDWKVMPSEAWEGDVGLITRHQGFYEFVHPAREPAGWKEPGFDDSTWPNAEVVAAVGEGPWKSLVPREIPFQTEIPIVPETVLKTGTCQENPPHSTKDGERIIALIMQQETLKSYRPSKAPRWTEKLGSVLNGPTAAAMLESSLFKPDGPPLTQPGHKQPVEIVFNAEKGNDAGSFILFDFGQEVSGFPTIHIESDSGGVLDLGYGELLFDGRIDPYRSKVKYADRVICEPGRTVWKCFEKRAFRYLQLDMKGFKGTVRLHNLGLVFSTYPVEWKGYAETSDPLMKQIWDLSVYTVQLNMDDAFMDCPWRERVQWWGDALVEAEVGYYAFGDTKLVRQGIRHIGQSQRENGITQCFYPGETDNAIPGFSLAWILSIADYYQWTGDRKAVSEHWPQVQRVLGWFMERLENGGTLAELHKDYWNFWDWADEFVNIEHPSLVADSFFVGALRAAEMLGITVGDKKSVRSLKNTRRNLVKSVNSRYWDKSAGLYRDFSIDREDLPIQFSQQGNAAAVLHGVCPGKRKASVLQSLLDGRDGLIEIATPYFAHYMLKAMFGAGMGEQALGYITERWGAMLDAGATTAWEHFDQKASLCHGWSASPVWCLGAGVLGVRPESPGWKSVLVRPDLSGLSWARGTVPTPVGDIKALWKKEPGSFTLEVVLPDKRDCSIQLPYRWDQVRELRLNGRKRKTDNRKSTDAIEIQTTGSRKIQVEMEL